MSVANVLFPSYKLQHLQEFHEGLNKHGRLLEEAEGKRLHEELKALHEYLQRRIFRISLCELGTEIKNLAYKTQYAISGKASKDDVTEAGTKLILRLEHLMAEEEEKRRA